MANRKVLRRVIPQARTKRWRTRRKTSVNASEDPLKTLDAVKAVGLAWCDPTGGIASTQGPPGSIGTSGSAPPGPSKAMASRRSVSRRAASGRNPANRSKLSNARYSLRRLLSINTTEMIVFCKRQVHDEERPRRFAAARYSHTSEHAALISALSQTVLSRRSAPRGIRPSPEWPARRARPCARRAG